MSLRLQFHTGEGQPKGDISLTLTQCICYIKSVTRQLRGRPELSGMSCPTVICLPQKYFILRIEQASIRVPAVHGCILQALCKTAHQILRTPVFDTTRGLLYVHRTRATCHSCEIAPRRQRIQEAGYQYLDTDVLHRRRISEIEQCVPCEVR